MNIVRHVPLGPALSASAKEIDFQNNNPHDEATQAFLDWMNTERDDLGPGYAYSRGRRTVLGRATVTIDEALTLLADVPTDAPSGRAWKSAVQASIDLTRADVARPYDECTYDTAAETAAQQALHDLAVTLRDTSPLLATVADTLDDLTLDHGDGLGDVIESRTRLTDEGLVVGNKNHCDKHDEDCYADDRALVKWEHLNAIAPGTENLLRDILADLDTHLPTIIGDDDNGRARIPTQYRDR